MQGLVIIGALVMCSFFSMGSALKCYHCAVVDGSVAMGRSICGDKDKMVSTDCNLLLQQVDTLTQTKLGYLPTAFAKSIGLDISKTVRVNKEDVKFKCAKMYYEINGPIQNGITGSIEATVHTCLPESLITPSWADCEKSENCHLCNEDECNSASGITSSLLLSIVLIALAMIRL